MPSLTRLMRFYSTRKLAERDREQAAAHERAVLRWLQKNDMEEYIENFLEDGFDTLGSMVTEAVYCMLHRDCYSSSCDSGNDSRPRYG